MCPLRARPSGHAAWLPRAAGFTRGVSAALLALVTPALPARGQGLAFTDVTAAAGVTTSHMPGYYSYWDYTGGGTAGDFDGDGWTDLLVFSGSLSGRGDFLLRNSRDGTFTDRATAWGLTVVHDGKGASCGDFDGDGRLDVYATSAGAQLFGEPGQHKLWRNLGGVFTDVAPQAGVNFTTLEIEDGFGSAFGDYDGDADLDLFVTGMADQNAGHVLFRNEGDGTFTDVTDASGLFAATPVAVRGFAPRFADMDGDGWPELLLAADFGSSRYFRNEGDGTFTDITETSGTGQDENGMGQTVGDLDGDGLLDWTVTSIYDPAQGWSGNKLYWNQGSHFFVEGAQAAGVDDGGFGWGAAVADFDQDGFPDLVETNGDGTFGPFAEEPSYLWRNNGDRTFTEIAASVGLLHTGLGKTLVDLDFDRDGDRDVAIWETQGSLTLFRNDLPAGPAARSLTIDLDTAGDPSLSPNGFGTRVRVTAGSRTWLRAVDGGDNYLGMSEMSAHFGLGAASLANELRVTWADGRERIVRNLALNQRLRCLATSSWIDLGGAKAGASPAPLLLASGSLVPGSTFTLQLTGAPPGAPALLVFGSTNLNAPAFGGTLVPSPDASLNLSTTGAGSLSLSLPWPVGATSGTTAFWQIWVLDPAAGGSLLASNGLAGSTP